MTKEELMDLLLEKEREEYNAMEELKEKNDSTSDMMFYKHFGRCEGFSEIFRMLKDIDIKGN